DRSDGVSALRLRALVYGVRHEEYVIRLVLADDTAVVRRARDEVPSVADADAVLRRGLAQLLSAADDLEVVGEASDGSDAVRLVRREQPDIVLMDLSMPVLAGIGPPRQIASEHPDVRVVVLTSFAERGRVLDALDAGAVGYL